jgi:hypothetical protein
VVAGGLEKLPKCERGRGKRTMVELDSGGPGEAGLLGFGNANKLGSTCRSIQVSEFDFFLFFPGNLIIPLKDPKVRYIIPSQVNNMWSSHESVTCGVNCIYLTFVSFYDILDLIISFFFGIPPYPPPPSLRCQVPSRSHLVFILQKNILFVSSFSRH